MSMQSGGGGSSHLKYLMTPSSVLNVIHLTSNESREVYFSVQYVPIYETIMKSVTILFYFWSLITTLIRLCRSAVYWTKFWVQTLAYVFTFVPNGVPYCFVLSRLWMYLQFQLVTEKVQSPGFVAHFIAYVICAVKCRVAYS